MGSKHNQHQMLTDSAVFVICILVRYRHHTIVQALLTSVFASIALQTLCCMYKRQSMEVYDIQYANVLCKALCQRLHARLT